MSPLESLEIQDLPEEATTAPRRQGLPEWLAGKISSHVMAARELKLGKRIEDSASDIVRRRRCAEVVANHLLRIHAHG